MSQKRQKLYEITPCLACLACLAFTTTIRYAICCLLYTISPDPQVPIVPPQVKPEPAVQV
jgi:hypothetical protein